MLLAGTYERFLFGFRLSLQSGKGDEAQQHLTRAYTYAAHQHAVKCVAAGGYMVASGGADDQIHLYDVKHGKDLGFLMNPGDGAVPCIQFYCPPDAAGAPSHMFSGSADGTIAVWRAGGGWEHLKLMRGHKASVNSITIHPSGRLAMSVAHDCTLRMWDLARGVSEFNTQLQSEAEVIAFTPSGDSYLLLSGNKITVHHVVGQGEVVASLEHQRRVSGMTQLSEHVVLAGLEDGSLKVWDTRTSTVQLSQERAHATRIRGLACVNSGFGTAYHHLASAASDGVIKLWDIRSLGNSKAGKGGAGSLQCLDEVATRARITCLTVADLSAPKPKAPPAAQPAAPAPAATAAAVVASHGKQAAGGNVAGKQQAQQQGKAGKDPKSKGTLGSKRPQYPGFEVVSEAQQVKKQRLKQSAREYDSDDDEEGVDEGAADKRLVKAGTQQSQQAKQAGRQGGGKAQNKQAGGSGGGGRQQAKHKGQQQGGRDKQKKHKGTADS